MTYFTHYTIYIIPTHISSCGGVTCCRSRKKRLKNTINIYNVFAFHSDRGVPTQGRKLRISTRFNQRHKKGVYVTIYSRLGYTMFCYCKLKQVLSVKILILFSICFVHLKTDTFIREFECNKNPEGNMKLED